MTGVPEAQLAYLDALAEALEGVLDHSEPADGGS